MEERGVTISLLPHMLFMTVVYSTILLGKRLEKSMGIVAKEVKQMSHEDILAFEKAGEATFGTQSNIIAVSNRDKFGVYGDLQVKYVSFLNRNKGFKVVLVTNRDRIDRLQCVTSTYKTEVEKSLKQKPLEHLSWRQMLSTCDGFYDHGKTGYRIYMIF
ncbi:hypothetical protein LguiA_017437 [Lonicera macranthoides]